MKKGFSIEIQLDLIEKERELAEDFADMFIINTITNNFNYMLKGDAGRHSFLKRGTFGFLFDKEHELVFRRISNNLRRFAIVKSDLLLDKQNGLPIVSKGRCHCSNCLGSKKVEWKYFPETYTYMKVGDIKG